ncbi:MAG TPA: hypothetical protein VEL50_09060 [Gemmatimonadales bacterium]|nr:hypothetical protein [Gemmatimonadales bacterium]
MRARFLVILSLTASARAWGQVPDSSRGSRTSMFETFVARHQLLVFPFAAYTHDHNFEYQPASLGYGLQEDFRGRYSSTAEQLFVAYGITDWLAVELESSDIRAHFEKSPSDTSATPARINESGIADFSGQVRMRLGRERGRRPEFFAGIEILPPSYRHRVLIGEPRWDVKGEIGATHGYRWGTMTFRTTIEYNHGDTHWDLGETSIEYLRQVSRTWRLFLAIEGGESGAPDEFVLVSAAGWRVRDAVYVKFANAVGLFSKSTDWEPQLGLMFAIH